jgi:hypothetical protein
MAHNGFRTRMLPSIRDPWVLLLSAFDGATTWACGAPVPLAAAVAAVTLGTGAAFTALGTKYRKTPAPTLRVGTRQHGLIELLDGHVRSLRALQRNGLPVVAQPKAQDALGAADAARSSVLKMAGAVDTLDEAISAARKVSGQGEHAAETINKTVGRLKERRAKLLGKLTAAADEVATVYAGLLEVSATALTMDVSLDDGDLGAINDSVTVLQMTLAELEADATKLSNDALR